MQPVIAEIVRSGVVEGRHYGGVVALDADGEPSYRRGDVGTAVLPRSCNKPLQALALVRLGLDLDGPLLALACASHSGEPFHLKGVREILARHGLVTERVGLLGWSMGGYGALRLAGELGAGRVAAVAAASPALWHTFAQSANGAFDDAADFARNTVFGRQRRLDGVAVRVDCGTGDGFCANDRDYVSGFATAPSGGFEAGGHNTAYWLRMNPQHVAFVGRALAA